MSAPGPYNQNADMWPYRRNINFSSSASSRPTLTLSGKEFYLHGSKARIVFRRDRISVGCTDGEVEALRELLKRYDEWANDREYVVQP